MVYKFSVYYAIDIEIDEINKFSSFFYRVIGFVEVGVAIFIERGFFVFYSDLG